MRQLFAFRGLAHDPQSVLAAVYELALVSIKLLLNAGISIFKAFSRKLDIAAFADTQHWNAIGAFSYSESASGHDSHCLAHSSGIGFLVEIKQHHYPKAGLVVRPRALR
jgi:hypothetical protein